MGFRHPTRSTKPSEKRTVHKRPGGRYVPTAGQPIPNNTYGKAWRDARQPVLTSAQQRSPLARRPYDLRHAAVSLWLNAGGRPSTPDPVAVDNFVPYGWGRAPGWRW